MNLISEDTEKLIYAVAQGNPGALAVIMGPLMWYTNWLKILKYLLLHEITGSKLWMLYKDELHRDDNALNQWLIKRNLK